MKLPNLLDALDHRWRDLLGRHGMPVNPTTAQVVIWQASRRRVSEYRDAVPDEAVRRRAAGQSTARIAADLDLNPSTLRHGLDLAALRLITPWLTDVPAWRIGRDDGHSDSEIAELYEVPEHLVRIALDGWPSTRPTPSSIEQEALRLWREGAEVTHVATAVGVSTDQLRQWLREGPLRLSPERLSQGQVAERFGWSKSLSRLYRLQGVLPAPDGGTRQNPWWWQSTITRVARTNLRYRCSQCRARFSTARGRSMHQTVMHRA
ncbi:hypothetical protein [Janibacter melonis]|uniref:hypothetical protein n=1 Tax=Janibacter melonis TaxID=262209 RepID=UPI00174A5A0C|nr:hypothetical protein [Janibacter melonis]